MKTYLKSLSLILFSLFLVACASTQDTTTKVPNNHNSQQSSGIEGISLEKKLLIDQLFEQTGQSASEMGLLLANNFIQQISRAIQSSNPDIDPRVFKIIEEEVKITLMEMFEQKQYEKLYYPIYDKHFSEYELKEMIAFNNTELGKKLIKIMPTLTREGMQAGKVFAKEAFPVMEKRVIARFEAEGLEYR